MRYLIYDKNAEPGERLFFTNYFTVENCYSPGLVVFDFQKGTFTDDGENWHLITDDHL